MNLQKISLILCAPLLLLPRGVSAATISLQAIPALFGVGDIVRVDILIDSANPVNAFSGALQYSSTTLEPVATSDGNSIISMWIVRPTIVNMGTPIAFAGITPGGFSGNKGVLFSVLFKTKESGTAKVLLKDVEVLRDDGSGGVEPTEVNQLALAIGVKALGGYQESVDRVPPEPFTVLLGTDPQLFSGEAYLIFTALDKGSGIDHYVVAETRTPSFLFKFFPLVWHETTSPYVLVDQDLTSTVYLKAVDRADNERLNIYPPQHLFTGYEKVIFLAILIGVVFLWQRVRERRRRLNS